MDIMNHNASFREFVYRVELSPAEIWRKLGEVGTCFGIRYRTDCGESRITFSTELPTGQPDITYILTLTEQVGYTVLKTKQLDCIWEKNRFIPLMNEFWKNKMGASPVDYILFG